MVVTHNLLREVTTVLQAQQLLAATTSSVVWLASSHSRSEAMTAMWARREERQMESAFIVKLIIPLLALRPSQQAKDVVNVYLYKERLRRNVQCSHWTA